MSFCRSRARRGSVRAAGRERMPCTPKEKNGNGKGGNEAERWPGGAEEWLAGTKHERAEVETILVDKTELREAPRQIGPGDVDVALDFRLQPAHERFDVVPHKRGVRADRVQRA